MKFTSFRYNTSVNLGDQVQSFAAKQYLPRLDGHVDRDSLNQVSETEHTIIMNGWFGDKPQNWPPSPSVKPQFFGFHATYFNGFNNRYLEPDSIAYLKTQEPIGCRDQQTRDWLRERGVDDYYSGCLTLTSRNGSAPKNGKVLLCDVEYYPVPRALRKRGSRSVR